MRRFRIAASRWPKTKQSKSCICPGVHQVRLVCASAKPPTPRTDFRQIVGTPRCRYTPAPHRQSNMYIPRGAKRHLARVDARKFKKPSNCPNFLEVAVSRPTLAPPGRRGPATRSPGDARTGGTGPGARARHTSTWRVRRGRGRLRCSPKPDPPHNLPALHTRSRPRITSALSLKNAKAYKSLHTAHRSPITDESHSMSRDICGCSHHSPRLARGRSMDYMYMCSTLHDFT